MRRAMVTVVNLNYDDGPTEYVLTPSAHAALTALGYQLKTGKQPETDAA